MVDSRLAFDIMARDDGATAVLDKVARAADKTGESLKKTSKISDDVAKSSANLTKARNAESDALDKVQVAEARLADVRNNSKSKTSQIVASEKALSKARRDAAVASNVAQKAAKDLGKVMDAEGKKAGKSFGSSLKKWITGQGANLGKEGGTVFGSGFLGALKTPVLGPAIVATLGAAVAVAAPAVGAVAAGGIVAGFGAGLGALGLVFAAKSKVVQDKWTSTMKALGADMRLLSQPLEATLVRAADVFRSTVDKFNPYLAQAFQGMAGPIADFVDEAGLAFQKLIPAVQPISNAFNGVLKALGPALQSALGSISDGMIGLANSVARNPQALGDFVKGLGGITKGALDVIRVLNDTNTAFQQLTRGTSLVTVTMRGIQSVLTPLMVTFSGLNQSINIMNALTHSTDASGKSMSEAANKTVGLVAAARTASTGLHAVADGAAHSAHETHAANVAASLLAGAYDRQFAATQKANEALTRMSGLLLTLSGSEIAYQQAVDDATASVKENGKTHDINTQKGRNNKTALDQVAASAQAQTVAMRNAGDGNVAAAKAATGARANFVKLAVQMGYTVPQAKAMAQSLIKIPNVTRTAKLNANKVDLEAKLASAKKQLADPNLTKERRAKLTADKKNAEAGIARINGMLGNLPKSKTITLTTNVVTKYTTVGSRSSGAGVGGGHIAPGRAVGGPVTKGMPYIVGEHRPELFVPKENGTIIPKVPRSAKGSAFAASGGGTAININVNGARDPHATADEVVRELRKYVRVSAGGDVQKAFGVNGR